MTPIRIYPLARFRERARVRAGANAGHPYKNSTWLGLTWDLNNLPRYALLGKSKSSLPLILSSAKPVAKDGTI